MKMFKSPVKTFPVHFSGVMMTPELAEELLERNVENNRSIKPATVRRYVEEIKAGAWKLTHQGICLNKEGLLVDGQHRLKAIVEANATVPMVIAKDFDLSFQSPLDVGTVRSLADRMGASPSYATVLRVVWWAYGSDETGQLFKKPAIDNRMVRIDLEIQELAEEFISLAGGQRLRMPTVAALVCFVHKGIVTKSRALAMAQSLKSGAGLEKGNPLLCLREWQISNPRGRTDEIFQASCKAFRYAVTGRSMQKMRNEIKTTTEMSLCGIRVK